MKLVKLTSLLLLSLLLTNCSQNEVVGGEEEREELLISSKIDIQEIVEPTTKAAFETGKELTLVVRDNNTPTSYFAQKTIAAETQAESSGKNGLTLIPKLYWDDLGGKNANIALIGISPNSATLSGDLITWDVTADQSAGVDSYDLMTALDTEYLYSERATPAHLAFNHALTKVTIVLKPKEGHFTVAELNNATLTFHTANKANFDVLKQKFKDLEGTAIKPYKTDYLVKPDELSEPKLEGYCFTILTMPFTAGEQLATISLGGIDYHVNVTSRALEAGVHTQYIVTLAKTDIRITASVTDWTTPEGIPVTARIVGLEDFTVTESEGVKITEGSTVTMLITDSTDPDPQVLTAVYEYKKIDATNYRWEATTPVYWDDITAPVTKVQALLKLAGDATNGELYLSGETTGSFNTQSNIDLGNTFFKHPLSKISIKIQTTDGDDKVNIEGITKVEIPGCGTFKVGTDGVTIEKDGNDNQVITGTPNEAKTIHTCISGYIYPQSLSELCYITIQENTNVENVYKVKLSPEKEFAAATHYSYTVTLSKTQISATAGIVDWVDENGGGINTGITD